LRRCKVPSPEGHINSASAASRSPAVLPRPAWPAWPTRSAGRSLNRRRAYSGKSSTFSAAAAGAARPKPVRPSVLAAGGGDVDVPPVLGGEHPAGVEHLPRHQEHTVEVRVDDVEPQLIGDLSGHPAPLRPALLTNTSTGPYRLTVAWT